MFLGLTRFQPGNNAALKVILTVLLGKNTGSFLEISYSKFSLGNLIEKSLLGSLKKKKKKLIRGENLLYTCLFFACVSNVTLEKKMLPEI